ncbi:hypothetical protein OED52_10240 [Rhodococcus sp. Z13]|uniref:Uncharacterized protein n=1 Tax=Rhodococcus sacchari TaxID=2962047 RepID=A0ACD4DLL9_9NOCA|nr:hypothetical protein [Rhodococcus sp. Z13]UYP20860.1 hypothetical protein OED52_10240 [Rhodococcus sp. Z13]
MRQNPIHKSVPVVLAGGLILAGCSSGDENPEIRNAADVGSASTTASESPYLVSVAERFPTCEAVGGTIAPYVDGLVLSPGSTVDRTKVFCEWKAPEGESPAGIRSVEISIDPETVTSATAAKTGLVTIPDERIEAVGGFAHSMPINMPGTAVTATGVELPRASVSITVSGRDTQVVLDPAGGVEVAKVLLGL